MNFLPPERYFRCARFLGASFFLLACFQVYINSESLRVQKDTLDAERLKIILDLKSKLPGVQPKTPTDEPTLL